MILMTIFLFLFQIHHETFCGNNWRSVIIDEKVESGKWLAGFEGVLDSDSEPKARDC